MATSYPRRDQASGIWKISDITSNIKTEGTWPDGGSLGVFAGGAGSPAHFNIIDYITISVTGNATDWGDLTFAERPGAGCTSFTRGLFGGHEDGPSNEMCSIELNSKEVKLTNY